MPLFVSAGAPDTTASSVPASETLQPTLPSPREDGDWLFCFSACRSATATVTAPAGWQTIYNVAGTYATMGCFARVVDGTEPAGWTLWSGLTTGASGSCAESRIVNMSTGFETDGSGLLIVDATSAVSNQAASSTIMAGGAGFSTITDNAIVFAEGIFTNNVATDMTDTFAAEILMEGLIADVISSSGAKMIHGSSWGTMTPAGAIAAHTWTMTGATSNNSSGVMVALRPTPPPPLLEQTDYILWTGAR